VTMTYAVVGHAGSIAMGEEVLPGEFSPSFGRGVWPAPYRVRAKKKFRSCGCFRTNRGVQLPGSGATPLEYSLFTRKGVFLRQQQGLFERADAGHGLSLTADAATRVFSVVCRPGSPHRSVILWRVPRAPPAGAAGSGGTGHRFDVRDEQDPASTGQDYLDSGDYRLRGKRG
jgi:hypothetical protein